MMVAQWFCKWCSLRLVLLAHLLVFVLGCGTGASSPKESAQQPVTAASYSVVDLEGEPIDPVRAHEGDACVLIFSRTDCPIARRYAPEIRRLHEEYESQGVHFYLVFPNPDRSGEEIRSHLSEFELPCDAVRDPGHDLVAATGVKVTPEAAVFDAQGELAYVGRIDDRFPKFGVSREATTHELEDAILYALGEGEKPVADGPAIGCYIGDLAL